MKLLIGTSMALVGALVGALIGFVVANDYIFRAADGTRIPGCGNVGMEPGLFIGLALGALAAVWIGRTPSSGRSS